MVGKIDARRESRKTPGKKFGTTTYKKGGKVAKKQVGGMAGQGYNARLDESLGARNPGATGSMAGRRAMSEGMERSMGRGPYSGASTMAKHGGTIKKKAKHGGAVKKRK